MSTAKEVRSAYLNLFAFYLIPPQVPLTPEELDAMAEHFYDDEPTADFLAEAMANGFANGTLPLSDSDYTEEEDEEVEEDETFGESKLPILR